MDKLSEGLFVTLLCMFIVFLVLASITLVIRLQRFLVEKGSSRRDGKKAAKGSEALTVLDASQLPQGEDEELIAVITAAVAASLGRPVSGVVVRSIRRAGSNTPAWSMAGRQESINTRF